MSMVAVLMCRGNVPISDPLSLKPSGAQAFGLIVRRKSFNHYLNIFLSRFSLSLLIPFTISPKFDISQLLAKTQIGSCSLFATCVVYRQYELAIGSMGSSGI